MIVNTLITSHIIAVLTYLTLIKKANHTLKKCRPLKNSNLIILTVTPTINRLSILIINNSDSVIITQPIRYIITIIDNLDHIIHKCVLFNIVKHILTISKSKLTLQSSNNLVYPIHIYILSCNITAIKLLNIVCII